MITTTVLELAKACDVRVNDVLDAARKLDIKVSRAVAGLHESQADRIRRHLKATKVRHRSESQGWIIRTSWRRSGAPAFWGHAARLTDVRAEAVKFSCASDAYDKAEQLRACGAINDFTVEDIYPPPVRHGIVGCGGRP